MYLNRTVLLVDIRRICGDSISLSIITLEFILFLYNSDVFSYFSGYFELCFYRSAFFDNSKIASLILSVQSIKNDFLL